MGAPYPRAFAPNLGRLLATIVLAVGFAAGCGGDEREYTVLQPDYMFAGETLHDWVSNGHQLSVISVVDATPPRPAIRDSGGLIDRAVTVQVERTLWRREGAPRAGRTLRFDVWGWMQENDQDPESPRTKIVSERAPRMEVGRRYLAVLVRAKGEWFPLTDQAVMTLSEDGKITSEVVSGEPVPGAERLRGKTLGEARAVFDAAS